MGYFKWVKWKVYFIFEEWDYIFNRNLYLEEQDKFLEFLMKLLKDKSYVALCYMTGILPIKNIQQVQLLTCLMNIHF